MGCNSSAVQSTFSNHTSSVMQFRNGTKIPTVGYGTWQATEEHVLTSALETALEAGYRHIDTATAYQNEPVIGTVLKNWFDSGKLAREDIFITTKLPPIGNRASDVEIFLNKSLKELQLDYIDLYLVHTPFGLQGGDNLMPMDENGDVIIDLTTDHVAVWKAMEALVDSGKVKAIGLSNFNERQIKRVIDNARILPENLQVELHLYLQQESLVKFCKENNITVTAYSPLGSPGLNEKLNRDTATRESLLNDPIAKELAEKYNKTTAQIALRFLVQRGIIVIPKSTTPSRIKENIDIFNFELTKDEMQTLKSLDRGEEGRVVVFDFFKGLRENHPEFPF